MKSKQQVDRFDQVLQTHQGEIYRYAMRLTCNVADADDLYQETFLKAFGAFPKLPEDANVRAWLYKITTNSFLSERRKYQRQHPLDDVLADTLIAPQIDPDRRLDAKALLDEVESFVTALPEKQRAALVLRKYHELGYDEIGNVLDCSESAARANVYAALQKLRDCFAERIAAAE